ncbi:hypothetical protein EMCLV076R [Equine molluscum contagiosum-like virus]|nr:hypothetical protein EMCLV076R [Equine molluscum contagiosum-like virus]
MMPRETQEVWIELVALSVLCALATASVTEPGVGIGASGCFGRQLPGTNVSLAWHTGFVATPGTGEARVTRKFCPGGESHCQYLLGGLNESGQCPAGKGKVEVCNPRENPTLCFQKHPCARVVCRCGDEAVCWECRNTGLYSLMVMMAITTMLETLSLVAYRPGMMHLGGL